MTFATSSGGALAHDAVSPLTFQMALDAAVDRVPLASPGLLGRALHHAMTPAGKFIRPLVLLAAAESVGGCLASCVSAANAIECLHVGSLVHDDVIDVDLVRRGRPSVYGAFGRDVALVAGDSLLFSAFDWAEDSLDRGTPGALVAVALSALARAGRELCRGQVLEAEMARTPILDLDTYLSMVAGKTASLMAVSGQIGALLGGGSSDEQDTWRSIGYDFGIAFQMQDDLLPYRDSGLKAGKDPLSDIRNGRISLPWLMALSSCREDETELLLACQRAAIRGRAEIDSAKVVEIVARADSVRRSEDIMKVYVDRAVDRLDNLTPSEGAQRVREVFTGSLRRPA